MQHDQLYARGIKVSRFIGSTSKSIFGIRFMLDLLLFDYWLLGPLLAVFRVRLVKLYKTIFEKCFAKRKQEIEFCIFKIREYDWYQNSKTVS